MNKLKVAHLDVFIEWSDYNPSVCSSQSVTYWSARSCCTPGTSSSGYSLSIPKPVMYTLLLPNYKVKTRPLIFITGSIVILTHVALMPQRYNWFIRNTVDTQKYFCNVTVLQCVSVSLRPDLCLNWSPHNISVVHGFLSLSVHLLE